MDSFYQDYMLNNNSNSNFPSSYFTEMDKYQNYFWFKYRLDLVTYFLSHQIYDYTLEIGCGNGNNLAHLKSKLNLGEIYASDIFEESLSQCKSLQVNLLRMDCLDIPFESYFDLAIMLDVLEHIPEDSLALEQVNKSLTKKGRLLLTVPQHQSLWSKHDELNCHVRRYGKKDLEKKLDQAGFHIIKSTSFVSLLLPALFASRLFKPVKESPFEDMSISSSLNNILYRICSIEMKMIKKFNLPWGSSRLVLCEKRS